MKTNRLFCFFSLIAIAIALAKIVVGLHFWIIPPVFFLIGFAAVLWNQRYSLYLFLFLFPFISITPGLFDNRYPFNYIAVPLFLLSGIVAASVFQRLRRGTGDEDSSVYIDKDFVPYYLFLSFLVISAIFVLLRWSNFTLGSKGAVGMDTPVGPPAPDITSPDQLKWSEQRVSFGSIFPVVSIFIYFISPYIFFLTRKIAPRQEDVFKWISYGFWISVGIALIQKLTGHSLVSDRLGKDFKQFYGGFSDFNAFGFFSGVMLVWATYEIRRKSILGYISFFIALAGGILSGSRTFYIFILAGLVNLMLWGIGKGVKQKKYQRFVTAGIVVLVLLAVFFAGGTLKKRFFEGFSSNEGFVKKLDAVTNGRVWMSLFTLKTIRNNFVPGVGTGNFTFYLSYRNYLPLKERGEKYVYDLPLNHYLLVFAENGVFAFACFTFFMLFLFWRSRRKLLMGTILFSLLLNNFFWFPEAFLLFWVLAALNYVEKPGIERKKLPHAKIFAGIFLLVFIAFNIISFNRLHPKTWAKETDTRYDYGFWYPEVDSEGREFRWTKANAGVYISPDKGVEPPEIKLVCGAPLSHLKEKCQRVEIYWKGKLYKEIIFTENRPEVLRLPSGSPNGGFLEVKVLPSFNIKELGLGPEPRDLGVQIYIP